ncbi:hypothetical protein FF1_046429 [Malus domestica]
MKHLRPISLCNILYKIIAKVLTNRLKSILLHNIPESSAFIPGRLILDNSLVAAEIAHYMHKKTSGWNGIMALKLDICKAYHRLEWNYLEAIMRKMRFSEVWIGLIMLSGELGKKNIHGIDWRTLCKPKWDGGLGFRDLYFVGTIAKFWWRLVKSPVSLAFQLLKVHHFPKCEFLKATCNTNSSYCWRSILAARNVLTKALRWQVGSGNTVRVWEDDWIPCEFFFKVITPPSPPWTKETIVDGLILNGVDVWNMSLLRQLFSEEEGASGSSSRNNERVMCKKVWEALETIEHVLRDCPMATAVLFSHLGLRVSNGNNVSLLDWLASLAHTATKATFELVLMQLWSIWRARNDLLWNGNQTLPSELSLRAVEWLEAFQKWHLPPKISKTVQKQRWYKPERGWIKCNFDRAWNERTRNEGIGVILRNCNGGFIAAYLGSFESVTSPLHVEMIIARRAICFVIQICSSDVQMVFEGYSLITLAVMRCTRDDTSIVSPIINDIRLFLLQLSHVKLNHVRNEANFGAH